MVRPMTRDPVVDSSGFTSGLMGRSVYELTRTERYTGTDRAWPESWVWGWGGVLRPAYGYLEKIWGR